MLLILVIQSREVTMIKKTNEIEKQITDHNYSDKYVATPEFNKPSSESFAST